MIRSPRDLEKLWPVPSVLEPLLENCREAAVIVARSSDGEIASYPAVSMEFDARFNAVASVTSPAVIPVELQETCEAVARRAVARLGAVGVFAVEFFIDEEARVYVNEISPRVHNSGHLTMEAFAASQFEQHVRAVMGLPLAPVAPRSSAAVMLNILFDLTWENQCKTPQGKLQVEAGPDTRLHWYGKSRGTEGRKMGHVTALGPSASLAAAKARRALSECSLQEAQCR
jgi:5-(carboxyamino)imidazole ribonucleotide synthase